MNRASGMNRASADVYATHRTGPVTAVLDAGLLVITLDDRERRNALTRAAKEALCELLLTATDDVAVRAVVLAGEGPAFCVGQDLAEHARELESGAASAFATVKEHYSVIVHSLLTMPKPVVAAIQGTCVGAGLGLALACDLRVMATGAKFGTAFAGIGLTFDTGLSVTLPRAVGTARAAELMLTGRVFTAEEAVAWGIAGEVVDATGVRERALELGMALAQGPTFAFAETKRILAAGAELPLEVALEREWVAQTRCGETDDHAGAVSAFLGKTRPVFEGR